MMAFLDRWARLVLVTLICIDQLTQTILVGLWWWLTGRGACPDPDETLSAFLGRSRGKWAVFPAALIDGLFLVLTLGRERNHCAGAAEKHGGLA